MLKHGNDYCNNWRCVCVCRWGRKGENRRRGHWKRTRRSQNRDLPLVRTGNFRRWIAPFSPAVGVQHSDPVITSSLKRRSTDVGPKETKRKKQKIPDSSSGAIRRQTNDFVSFVFFFRRRRRTSWSLKECRDLLRIFRTPQGHSGRKADCLYHQVKHRPAIVIFVQFPWNVQVENCTLVGSPEFPADTVPGGLFRPIPVKLALSECRRTLTKICVFFFYMKFDETDLI